MNSLFQPLFNHDVGGLRRELETGAEVDFQNLQGITALYFAVINGLEELVQLLFDRGADPTIPSKFGRSPLDEAVSRKRETMIALLRTTGI